MAHGDVEEEERVGLLAGETVFNRLRAGGRRLDEAKRTALEAEEIGMNVMSELHEQRSSIFRTKAHLAEVGDNLDISRRILHNLGFRAQVDHVMLLVLAFLLTVAVLVTIYAKIHKVAAAIR
mmetsp:Transcript_112072/g.219704  ORF Transcript_112072/g.219704 Transcript_112072/m.219704 type:complete len:122 (+) Transcript_112072:102-467(+)